MKITKYLIEKNIESTVEEFNKVKYLEEFQKCNKINVEIIETLV